MADQGQKLKEALNEVEGQKQEESLLTLSSGVVVRAVPVSPLLMDALMRRYKPPKPPQFKNEENGRYYENRDDPDWLDEVQKLEQESETAALDLLFAKGVELISIPDGMARPEEDEWVEDIKLFAGVEIDPHPRLRLLAWIKYVAAQRAEDLMNLGKAVMQQTGVSEDLVSQALASFRSDTPRLPDSGSVAEAQI